MKNVLHPHQVWRLHRQSALDVAFGLSCLTGWSANPCHTGTSPDGSDPTWSFGRGCAAHHSITAERTPVTHFSSDEAFDPSWSALQAMATYVPHGTAPYSSVRPTALQGLVISVSSQR